MEIIKACPKKRHTETQELLIDKLKGINYDDGFLNYNRAAALQAFMW
jgi:hypothetical protein